MDVSTRVNAIAVVGVVKSDVGARQRPRAQFRQAGSFGPPLDEVPVELLAIVEIHICAPLRVG